MPTKRKPKGNKKTQSSNKPQNLSIDPEESDSKEELPSNANSNQDQIPSSRREVNKTTDPQLYPSRGPGSTNNQDLTQKISRLLSLEPNLPSSTSNPLGVQPLTNATNLTLPILNNLSDSDHQLSLLVDQKCRLLDDKLKLYQKQIAQLRSELETKKQVLEELQKIPQSDVEKQLEKHKALAEGEFSASAKVIKAQAEELKSSRQTIKDLNAKLSRVYSGEEERNRLQLEQENQELLKINEQLKIASDTQRRRRKEAERELQRANSNAQEAVRGQLKEANDEIRTLKKMLEAETENSKGLISQLNQFRMSKNVDSTTAGGSGGSSHHHPTSSSHSHAANEKTIEDLKARASVIGDFTGFEILNSSADKKGNIFDCIVTDIVDRGLALNFKLQFHSDNTCSYFPALDKSRDAETIKILPDFLRSFVRFQNEASGHVFYKLFQAFNL